MKFSQTPSSLVPLTDPPNPMIPLDQVWVNLTVNQQEQLLQTILVICRELFAPRLLPRESEVKHD